MALQRFYRYNEQQVKRQEEERSAAAGTSGIKGRIPYWYVFKKCFPQCLNVFLVFFVTLSIFPTIYSGKLWLSVVLWFLADFRIPFLDVKPVDSDFIIPERFFVAVTCFLSFNFFAMVGNMLPGIYAFVRKCRLST